ncbi:MAG: serine hydrolase domain-containing protein [Ferruginibacter sp.]
MITISLLANIATAQQQKNIPELLKQYFDLQQKRIGFNGVVLVARNGEVISENAFGFSSIELNVPMQTDNKFLIASVSKQFTAMLTVNAVSEGKLHFDDTLAMFFPEINKLQWRSITIQQLLNHSSGIPHNEGIADYWTGKALQDLTEAQGIAAILQMKLLFKPGTDVKYSSPGYMLLYLILQKIYGTSYSNLLQQKIKTPLQLTATGEYTSGKIISGMASPYHLLRDSLIKAPHRSFSLMKGSGNLYSTAEDLLKWNEDFINNNVWRKSIDAKLSNVFSQHTINENAYYTNGIFIKPGDESTGNAFFHGGGSFGCSAITVVYPKDKIIFILLSNVSFLPVQELWQDAEKIIFNKPFALPELNNQTKLSDSEMMHLTGAYEDEQQQMKLLIITEKNQLYAKLGNNPPFEIFATDKMHFFGKKVNVKFTFTQDESGVVRSVQTEGRGRKIFFNKQ